MAFIVQTAEVGTGKTEAVIQRIISLKRVHPLARVWVLLATERQINAFRDRLVAHLGDYDYLFHVELFTVYQLYGRVLDTLNIPTRQLSEPSRLQLLRQIMRQSNQESALQVFDRVVGFTGFVQMVADFINEQKQTLISPRDLSHVHDLLPMGELKSKLADLSTIYRLYQEYLQYHHLVDREGMGWLALDSMLDQPSLSIDLLAVDGYDQFTPLQAQIIARLSQHSTHTLVTLTTVPHRTDTIGKRFEQAQHTLRVACEHNALVMQTESLSSPFTPNPSDLQYLTQSIFRFGVPSIPSNGGIFFLAGENEQMETRQVLRRVKDLLLHSPTVATTPDDIIIILRDYARYFPHLERVAKEYGIPLAMHLAQPLVDVPIVHLILSLLQLHVETPLQPAFPPQDVLDSLHSPYLSILNEMQLRGLEQICRQAIFRGGVENWQTYISQNTQSVFVTDDEQESSTPLTIEPTLAHELQQRLEMFFRAVTPPQQATSAEYVLWLDQLIGQDRLEQWDEEPSQESATLTSHSHSLELVQQIRTFTEDEHSSRELSALVQFKSVLRGLLADALFVSQVEGQSSVLTWAEFFIDLQNALGGATLQPSIERGGKVLVTTAVNARGLPHQHVFIMGLSEGIFPQATRSDRFLLDDERLCLRGLGLQLETASERSADDGLFYELISQAQHTLTLSRPTTQKGNPWMPSHLWRGVERVFDDAPHLIEQGTLGVARLPQLEQVASDAEWFLGVSVALNSDEPLTATQRAYANQAFAQSPDKWRTILDLIEIEKGRITRTGALKYRGHITDPALKDALMQRYSARHTWSASQLNELGVCGFRFFAGRVLNLVAYEEPTLGLNAAQLGTLNHSILEQLYHTLADQQVRIYQPNLAHALALLDQLALETFRHAPNRLGFSPTAYWEEEQHYILQHLRKLVEYDFTDLNKRLGIGTDDERYPMWQEKSFGLGQKGLILQIAPDLEPIVIRGVVDRVDQVGNSAAVLDYKTGGTKITLDDMVEGRNFQMMLYLYATQTLLHGTPSPSPQQVYGGAFLHIRSQEISGKLLVTDEEYEQNLERAKHALKQNVLTARDGIFSIEPSKPSEGKCIAHCQFNHLCRLSQQR
ncbi:MAG: PD-(D/E)XK nuclease family protein [Phototrophicaceae bacterium]